MIWLVGDFPSKNRSFQNVGLQQVNVQHVQLQVEEKHGKTLAAYKPSWNDATVS